MKIKLHHILAIAVAFGSTATAEVAQQKQALPGIPERTQSGAQGSMPEVVIKGGERSGVKSERKLLEVELNPDDPIQPTLEVEEDMLGSQPEAMSNPKSGTAQYLANPRLIVPARFQIAKDPVKVFYPLRQIMAVSPTLSQEIGTGWEMVITDTEGRSFRKFSGRGLPPSNISWNGRSDRAEIVGVGKNYSPVITYQDIRGQTRNFVGEPFTFNGVMHQESKGLIISLSPDAVFDGKKSAGSDRESIGDNGMALLEEAADWVKRNYYTFPLRIESYGKSETLAGSRGETVAKTLGKMLLLHRGEIPASGSVTDPGNERIDIIVANR